MDGVLIDAKEWHYEALNEALSLFGKEISRHDHLVTYDGLPTKKKLEILSQEGNLPKGLHTFINDMKQQFTMNLIVAKCRPTFQHQFALSKLKSEGYKLAVCSNSIRKTVEVMMEKSSLNRFLDFYLSNQDVKTPKPSPEIYKMAIERLELSPNECLILEDNENGKKAALASGAHLLEVGSTLDVDYVRIKSKIKELEHA